MIFQFKKIGGGGEGGKQENLTHFQVTKLEDLQIVSHPGKPNARYPLDTLCKHTP